MESIQDVFQTAKMIHLCLLHKIFIHHERKREIYKKKKDSWKFIESKILTLSLERSSRWTLQKNEFNDLDTIVGIIFIGCLFSF